MREFGANRRNFKNYLANLLARICNLIAFLANCRQNVIF